MQLVTPVGSGNEPVIIDAGGMLMEGELGVPHGAEAIIIVADESGRARKSNPVQRIAHDLREGLLGTVVLDLLSARESRRASGDIEVLAQRIAIATQWLARQPFGRGRRIGCFASGATAAAAIAAASELESIGAVVCRSGRPDLARGALGRLDKPTLLIVGSEDLEGTAVNKFAFEQMSCTKKLANVFGAGSLFDEPGSLETVSQLARDWFLRHLTSAERYRAGDKPS